MRKVGTSRFNIIKHLPDNPFVIGKLNLFVLISTHFKALGVNFKDATTIHEVLQP